jgi:threonine/homoserine/homoserine lactone efflux protein
VFQAISKGLGLGIAIALTVGPAFFTLIQTSLKSGFRAGMFFSIGILFSDLLCVVLCYLGASQLLNDETNFRYMGIIGGSVIVVFGLISLFKKNKKKDTKGIVIEAYSPSFLFTKGFLINILNPFVWLWWIVAMTTFSAHFAFQKAQLFVFFTTALLTVISTDLLKAFIANKIKSQLTVERMSLINSISSFILVGFGLYLIFKVTILKQ